MRCRRRGGADPLGRWQPVVDRVSGLVLVLALALVPARVWVQASERGCPSPLALELPPGGAQLGAELWSVAEAWIQAEPSIPVPAIFRVPPAARSRRSAMTLATGRVPPQLSTRDRNTPGH